ncbi:MAG: hypothetical protein JO331_05640 [Verrucomicrobia bacterium]|nr:hypothetical protein [Verrucomicrobiota bacterium]
MRLSLGLFVAVVLAWTPRPSLAQNRSPSPGLRESRNSQRRGFSAARRFLRQKIQVQKTAQNTGLQNTYRLTANGQEYEITGSEAALQLWQEWSAQ